MKTIQFGSKGIELTLRKQNGGLDVGVVVPEGKVRSALAEIERIKKRTKLVPGLGPVLEVVTQIEIAVLEVLAEERPAADETQH